MGRTASCYRHATLDPRATVNDDQEKGQTSWRRRSLENILISSLYTMIHTIKLKVTKYHLPNFIRLEFHPYFAVYRPFCAFGCIWKMFQGVCFVTPPMIDKRVMENLKQCKHYSQVLMSTIFLWIVYNWLNWVEVLSSRKNNEFASIIMTFPA